MIQNLLEAASWSSQEAPTPPRVEQPLRLLTPSFRPSRRSYNPHHCALYFQVLWTDMCINRTSLGLNEGDALFLRGIRGNMARIIALIDPTQRSVHCICSRRHHPPDSPTPSLSMLSSSSSPYPPRASRTALSRRQQTPDPRTGSQTPPEARPEHHRDLASLCYGRCTLLLPRIFLYGLAPLL